MSMLVKGEHVTLGYEGTAVHRDLSFAIEEGDYVCVLGANGTGKSTLVKALLGLHSPLEGKITFAKGFSSKQIGYLPQQSIIQRSFPASVEEVVLSGRLNSLHGRPFFRKSDKEETDRNLERMGILDLKKACYQELSGGQQQRVLLARALSATGRMLLLDEPVSGLDPHSASEMYHIISSLHQEGITIIMVTHDIHPALNDADSILYLASDGFFFGHKEDFFQTDCGHRFLEEAGHHHV